MANPGNMKRSFSDQMIIADTQGVASQIQVNNGHFISQIFIFGDA